MASDRNPEPPAELLAGGEALMHADSIGDTVFSKHWLFTTLMRLIQAVDNANESKEDLADTEAGVDLDEPLQDELCKLWDMSMNSEVVAFLQEFNAIDILTGVITRSRAPRATEICIGILGNMACDDEVCNAIAANEKLIDLILLLLETPDTPTLVETTRFLHVSISNSTCQQQWLTAIRDTQSVFTNIKFILKSSTNNDLLHNTAELVDKLMDVDENWCMSWGTADLVQAILEAIKQVSGHSSDTLDTFIHTFQLMSTSEQGVHAMVEYADQLTTILLSYLKFICEDDIVGVEGRENSLASAISVFTVVMAAWQEGLTMLEKDYQLIRCMLKILEVVYSKVTRNAAKEQRARVKRTTSETRGSPKRHNKGNDEAKTPETLDKCVDRTSPANEGNGDSLEGGSLGDHKDMSQSESSGSYCNVNMIEVLYEVIQSFLVEIIMALSNKSNESKETVQVTFHQSESSADSPEQRELSNSAESAKVKVSRQELADTADDREDSPSIRQGALQSVAGSESVPAALHYLDSSCSRERIQDMLWTVQGVQGKDSETCKFAGYDGVEAVKRLAQRYKLERLARIVGDTMGSQHDSD